jgi:hypothetical protein
MTTEASTERSPRRPSTSCNRQVTRNWFTRQLRPVSPMWQNETRHEEVETHKQVPLRRPRTAPSTSSNTMDVSTPFPFPPPLPRWELSNGHEMKAPPRPPRPDSGVMRDVNAWLDASKPTSPLMGGLPYWREGTQGAATEETTDVQYAIPIVRETEGGRPSTPGTQQLKSFCRRARRMQVRMPSLHRTRSQCATVQKKLNRRSTSSPLMGIPYEGTQEGFPPRLPPRFGFARRPPTATIARQIDQNIAWPLVGSGLLGELPLREMPTNAGSGVLKSNIERNVDAVFGQTARGGVALGPVPFAARIQREDSVGSISDAPTYVSGPPPPSYRSRAASILTTSSFGCIDGMNTEQRELSQQRAQQKRGVKGKLKRFAQRCALTKGK